VTALTMSTFLYGPMLSAKINELLSEACTCIVSYIGDGATKKIKGLNKSKKVRVICNFHSNGKNPAEVERLINFLGTDKVKDMDSFAKEKLFCRGAFPPAMPTSIWKIRKQFMKYCKWEKSA
jgi:hypothetical protein